MCLAHSITNARSCPFGEDMVFMLSKLAFTWNVMEKVDHVVEATSSSVWTRVPDAVISSVRAAGDELIESFRALAISTYTFEVAITSHEVVPFGLCQFDIVPVRATATGITVSLPGAEAQARSILIRLTIVESNSAEQRPSRPVSHVPERSQLAARFAVVRSFAEWVRAECCDFVDKATD